VHHTASWCRTGRGLRKSAFKPTIKDTAALGKLKNWNAPKQNKHAVDAALVFQPTISIPPVMQMIKKSHGNLMCQLALLRASEGSFPEEDFKPLATMTALASSTDTIRMNLARVLVTKVLNEGKRPRCFSSCSLSCNRHSCRHLVYADA